METCVQIRTGSSAQENALFRKIQRTAYCDWLARCKVISCINTVIVTATIIQVIHPVLVDSKNDNNDNDNDNGNDY